MSNTDFLLRIWNIVYIILLLGGIIVYVILYRLTERSSKEKDAQIANARNTAEQAHKETESIRQQNLTISLDLEKQRTKYLELYNAVSPRIIDETVFSKRLAQYSGTHARISSMPDGEANEIARQVVSALELSGWHVESFTPITIFTGGGFEGIQIQTNLRSLDELKGRKDAAQEVIEAFHQFNIEAKRFISPETLPDNTVKISIGKKPSYYFAKNKSGATE